MSQSDSIRYLSDEVERFARERDWHQFHNAKNLVMLLTSEAGELAAEYRWVDSASADRLVESAAKREAIADEIADVAIALLMLSSRIHIDLGGAVLSKLERNERRYPVQQSRGQPDRPGQG